MRCPYCKNSQTEVFRTKCLRSKTYRYRRCQSCKAKFRTQEKPVRWEGVDRRQGKSLSEEKRFGPFQEIDIRLRALCNAITCSLWLKTPEVWNSYLTA
jgi:hypothetical protein